MYIPTVVPFTFSQNYALRIPNDANITCGVQFSINVTGHEKIGLMCT